MKHYPRGGDLVPTFNWVFDFQPIMSETQPSRYKRAGSNYLADEKDPHHLGHVVVWVIHLYLYIYWFNLCRETMKR